MIVLLATVSLAADPAVVQARIDEVATLRARRIADGAPAIPADAYATAAEGTVYTGLEAVEGIAARKGYGVGVYDVPIARLWAAINDDAGKVARTKLDYAEILEGTACVAPRTVFQYLPLSMVSDRWWVSEFRDNPGLASDTGGRVRELHWDSHGTPATPTSTTAKAWADQGVPLAWSKGGWFLVDVDGKSTVVEYFAWSDPGGSVPAGLASRFSSSSIADTLATVAQLALDGPGCPVR